MNIIHLFMNFAIFSLFRYVTNCIFSREQGPGIFFGFKKKKDIVSPVHTIGLNFLYVGEYLTNVVTTCAMKYHQQNLRTYIFFNE